MSRRIKILCVVLSLYSILMSAPGFSESPISVRITPQTGFAPLSAVLTLRVPHHANNRTICVVVADIYDSMYYRSSCWEHTEKSPLQTVDSNIARNLPYISTGDTAQYTVHVQLTQRTPEGVSTIYTDEQSIRVLE